MGGSRSHSEKNNNWKIVENSPMPALIFLGSIHVYLVCMLLIIRV